jgi:RecA/RadA recombinase
MAKKSAIEKLLEQVTFKGTDFVEKEKKIIKLSPTLNYLLGGGIQEGSFTLISGVQKFGKTAGSLYIAKQLQSQEGYKLVYLNGEHRISNRDLRSTLGLDLEKVEVITSTAEKTLYAEDFVNITRAKIESNEKTIVVADSLSQMCPRDLAEKTDIGENYRDPTAKILSNLTKVLAPALSVTNNIFIGIAHTITNTSGYGAGGRRDAGGVKIQYAHDFKLEGLYAKPWENTGGSEIGKIMHWKCGTSALGPPNRTATGYLRYGHGIDEERELLELAKLAGLPNVKLSGAWWTIFDQRAQGTEKAVELIKSDKELFKSIEKEVWEVLGDKVSFGESEDDGSESEDVPNKNQEY